MSCVCVSEGGGEVGRFVVEGWGRSFQGVVAPDKGAWACQLLEQTFRISIAELDINVFVCLSLPLFIPLQAWF